MKRITLILLTLALTACDVDTFNQFFRNPYIVEIAELNTMEANKWYEFDTELQALHRIQEIVISFDQEGGYLDFKNIDGDSFHFLDKKPEEEILFNILVIDSMGSKYEFKGSGVGGGIIYVEKFNKILKGEVIRFVKVKSNIDFNDVKITWMSRTGK